MRTMLRKTLVAIGVLGLFAGISCAGYWGLTPIRYGSYKVSGHIRSRHERAFHEYLPEGTYLISLYGSGGHVWRSDTSGDYWGLGSFLFGLGRDEPRFDGRGLDRDRVGTRKYEGDGEPRPREPVELREYDRPGQPRLGDRGEARKEEPEVQVERRYSSRGKLEAVRPKGLPLDRDRRLGPDRDVGARHLDRRGSRSYGWYDDLPSRHRGGPDVDLYVFNRYGRLVAVSDSYESSESVMLRVHGWSGRLLEFVVYCARGSGSYYLTIVRF